MKIIYLSSAYLGGKTTPVDIAKDIIEKIKFVNSEMHILCDYREDIILEQAEASTKRYKEGKVLGALDGVPIVIKDQINIVGLTTRNGSSYPEFFPSESDAAIIERVKAQGN